MTGPATAAVVATAAAAAAASSSRKSDLAVTVDGRNIEVVPVQRFKDAGFPKALLKCTEGFERPTPIQSHTWPVANAKRDLIGIAETGSGKTLAFALPGLARILPDLDAKPGGSRSVSEPGILVLAPTRELAVQIAEVFGAAGSPCGVRGVCIFGGIPKEAQREALRARMHVVVATPGRLLDLVQEKCVSLAKVKYLVLDEADRMLDLGFEEAIRALIGMTPRDRQTLMFSATWPQQIQDLANEFLHDPVRVTVGSADLTANHNVQQIVEVLEPDARERRLLQLLREYHASRTNRVLIFVLYKKEAERMESVLQAKGWKVRGIHGDKGQADRLDALAAFKDGTVPLLIATDVAARGLDIPNVEYVINYTFPLTIEDYIHRIGRTGRAGRTGVAHTFFTVNEKGRAGELSAVLTEAKQPVPEALLQWGTHTKRKEHKLYGAFYREEDEGRPAKKAEHIKFD